MSTADRVAAKINRSHRFLKPLWERGRGHEVLFQSGTGRINTRTLSVDGTDFVDFATTSYLGLDSDPTVIRACIESLKSGGLHRYISRAFFSVGEYAALESRLANVTGLPRTNVFTSVTSLHQTLLPLLTAGDTLVIADEQVHHSMHEALRACEGVEICWTPHNDLAAMRAALAEKPAGTDALILADGVYSLEGEVAPVKELYELATETDSLLYLDDSHGFGVFGQRGEGVPCRLGAERNNLIYIGSLSKAMGCYGAFVATTEGIGAAIRDFAGGLIFSGPLPSARLAGAVAATDILLSPRLAELQARLWENQQRVIDALHVAGHQPLSTESPVLCVDFTDFKVFESAVTTLRDHCILVSAVAFPAVPRGHYRIRLSISANHTREDIDRLAKALLHTQAHRSAERVSPMGAPR